MSSVYIGHHHPESGDFIGTLSRSEYEPRSRHYFDVSFCQADWQAVVEATDKKANVL